MKRNEFLKTMAATVPAAAVLPNFSNLAQTETGKVTITDVKFMRVQIGPGVMFCLLSKSKQTQVFMELVNVTMILQD